LQNVVEDMETWVTIFS